MRLAILLIVFICSTMGVAAQRPFTRNFWLNDANIPVRVNAMLQDGYGYLWLGTDDGVYRFNGRQVRMMGDSARKPVTAITMYGNTIVSGHSDGSINILEDDKFVPFRINGAKPASAISDMYCDGAGVLWVCTEGQGFYMIMNNIGVACNTSTGLSDDYVYNISVFPGKHLVVSTDQGINEVSVDKGKLSIRNFTTEEGLADNIVRTVKPMPDNSACWVAMQDGGIGFYCRKSRQVWMPVLDSAWHWGQINDVLPLAGNKAWVATEDGYLVELSADKELEKIHTRAYRFEGIKMRKLILGRSGIVWCGTNTGLTMITDEYMLYKPVDAPYALNNIRSLTCDEGSNILFSLQNKLYSVPATGRNTKPQFLYEAKGDISVLHTDADGVLWIGTLGAGVYYRKQGVVSKFSGVDALNNESVLDINTSDGYVWVAGLNGVEQIAYNHATMQPGTVTIHNKKSGAGSDYVYQVFPDSKGRIWMATDGGGVVMYDKGKYTQWKNGNGISGNVVYTIAEDALHHIWLSTFGNGVYMYDGKTWVHVSTRQGLQDVNVHTIAANATGQVALIHDKGIDVWYPYSRQFRSYNSRQGMHIDSTSATLKLYAKDKTGNFYVPFEHGFIIFKNVYSPFDIRPNVRIENISVLFKKINPDEKEFSHNQNHITFNYEGINFANPDKLHYRYMLEGYNEDWVVTNDEAATFPQLPPAKYTFKVQASLNNSFGRFNEASYTFVISKPFWRTGWFLLLISGVLVAAGYTYISLREKNLRKLSSLQRERMMFEYEHLKSQVNPHFLFNSLNTLASLIEEDKEVASQYTTHLSDLYRNMLSFRNKDLVLLSEEWHILENYIYIQQSRFGDAMKLVVNIPEHVMKTKQIVPLALQLLVENALKHNVVSMSKPLTITIEATEEMITIRNTYNPKISKEKGEGLGLSNVQRRYSLLTEKRVHYRLSEKEFIVNLPLL